MRLGVGIDVRCAAGQHDWVPVDVLRRPRQREQRCRGCGAYGMWMSAADAVRDTEWSMSEATSSLTSSRISER